MTAPRPGAQRNLARLVDATLRNGGNGDALEFEGTWHSWAQIAASADATTQALAGGGPQRIGLVARNRPAVFAALLGLISQGHTVVMLHGAQEPERLAGEIQNLQLSAVIGEARYLAALVVDAAARSGVRAIVLPNELGAPLHVHSAGTSGAAGGADPAIALELLSSGTTGPPKRIPIGWHTLEEALGTAHGTAMFEADGASLTGRDLPPAISGLSLGNIGGIYMMLPSVLIGQRIVMLDRFAVEPWVRAVRQYRPTILSVQPVGLRMILEARVPREELSSLHTIVSGASRLDPDLQDRFEEAYAVRVFGAYGATETCGSIIVWTDALYDAYRQEKRGSVGKPIPGVAVRIVDPVTGEELGHGRSGLLQAKVDRVGPDWIATTDLAHVDADGFVFITGRADDAIDRGGFSVPPETVADALRAHPAVRDASVVGVPDPRLGEVPVAAVELVEGAQPPSEADLIAFAQSRLLAYQVPVRIRIVDELPRNASLKVLAPAVRSLFAE